MRANELTRGSFMRMSVLSLLGLTSCSSSLPVQEPLVKKANPDSILNFVPGDFEKKVVDSLGPNYPAVQITRFDLDKEYKGLVVVTQDSASKNLREINIFVYQSKAEESHDANDEDQYLISKTTIEVNCLQQANIVRETELLEWLRTKDSFGAWFDKYMKDGLPGIPNELITVLFSSSPESLAKGECRLCVVDKDGIDVRPTREMLIVPIAENSGGD